MAKWRNICNLIWPIFNIFLKFHLLVYFIFQSNDIGDTCAATLWRRISEDSRSLKKQKPQNLSAESQQK